MATEILSREEKMTKLLCVRKWDKSIYLASENEGRGERHRKAKGWEKILSKLRIT